MQVSPPFPEIRRPSPAFRFLNTTGMPARIGDISYFEPRHINRVAGAPVVGVWRPSLTSATADLTIERGVLSISGEAGVVILHTLLPHDASMAVELALKPIGAFNTRCAVFVGPADVDSHLGVCIEHRTTASLRVSDSAGPTNYDLTVPRLVGSVDMDLAAISTAVPTVDLSVANSFIQVGNSPSLLKLCRFTSDLGENCWTEHTDDRGFNWEMLTMSPVSPSSAAGTVVSIAVDADGGSTAQLYGAKVW